MMRKWLTYFGCALLSFGTVNASSGHCAVEAGAEALLWKPMHCVMNFGFQRTTITGIAVRERIFPLKSNYDWGVRAGLGGSWRCWNARLSYLWYQSVTRDERRSDQLDLFPNTAPIASSGIRGLLIFDYQNIDLRIGRTIVDCKCADISWFLNGRWLELTRFQRSQNFAPLDAVGFGEDVSTESYRGGAFGVGAHLDLNFSPVKAFFDANPLIAIGHRKDHVRFRSGNTSTQRNLLRDLAIVPGLQVRAGVSTSRSCWGMQIQCHIGYELHYYWDVFPQELVANFNPRPALTCDSIGFAGPLFGIMVTI